MAVMSSTKSVSGLYLGAYVVAGLMGILLWFADRSVLTSSGLEDAFAENLTAVLYFMAFLLTLSACVASRSGRMYFFGWDTSGSIWLLLLAVFFFVCFGEEVSWGQRIFGWATPETWKEVNGHSETNLHNILDNAKVDAGRLLTLIALSYGVLLPILDRFSERARRFIAWSGVPVPPLETAGLFVIVFVAYRALRLYYPDTTAPYAKAIREYHEAGYAAAFLVVAIGFFLTHWGQNRRTEGLA
jgi:hypothetical protein